jgi:hypothetical protein
MKRLAIEITFLMCTAVLFIGMYLTFARAMHKFQVGDCLKGSAYYYKVYRSSGFFYDLQLINFPYYFTYKKQVVHKSFKKVACDEVPSNANIPTK